MRINLTKVTESLSSSSKLHAALVDTVPKSPGRITAQRDSGSPMGEVIPSQCHFSIRRGEASASFSHRHQSVHFCIRFGPSFGMDEAMSGLDSFHFVMSDKYKRIKTQTNAKELRPELCNEISQSQGKFQYSRRDACFHFHLSRVLVKSYQNRSPYVTFCAYVNDGTR